MVDQQALFKEFLTLLQSEPDLPEYLGAEPEAIAPFDPYQMVAEWIALRHEVKQQGKLLQVSQTTLKQAVEGLQAEKADLQQQLIASQNAATENAASQTSGLSQSDQKALWRDLLGVMDALDQAYNHWQEQIEDLTAVKPLPATRPRSRWQRWLHRWLGKLTQTGQHETMATSMSYSLRDILVSNQEGVALIRRSLLDVLRQREVVPIAAQGNPFNPQTMYAIGRQETTAFPENIVVQEVVRGYLWDDQILREAQVIVAGKQR